MKTAINVEDEFLQITKIIAFGFKPKVLKISLYLFEYICAYFKKDISVCAEALSNGFVLNMYGRDFRVYVKCNDLPILKTKDIEKKLIQF